jgi:uncharacterized protein YoxC
VIRSVVIFCPLAVTWLGLLMASNAYQSLAAADRTAEGASFLRLWIDGFHGRTIFSLPMVAGVSAVLIGLLIVLTFTIERLRQTDDSRFQKARLQARHRLQSVALLAQLDLARYRLSSPERFREELTRSSAAFGQLLQQMAHVANTVASSTYGLGAVADRLDAVARTAGDLQQQIVVTADDMRLQVAALDRTVGQATQDLQTSVRLSADDSSRTITTAADMLRQFVQTHSDQVIRSVQDGQAAVDAVIRDGTEALGRQVDASAGWIVGAGEAILEQADRALASSTQTYDAIARTTALAADQVAGLEAREQLAASLLSAADATSRDLADTRAAIAEFSRAVGDLPPRREPAEIAHLDRAAAAMEALAAHLVPRQPVAYDPARPPAPMGYAGAP